MSDSLLMLLEMIEEVLEEEEINEASLSLAQMAKSPTRLKAFIDKYSSGKPFELVGGGEVVLQTEPQILAALEQMYSSGIISTKKAKEILKTNMVFKSMDGKRVSFSNLQKTSEFGGKGSGFYVKKEEAARGQLDDLIKNAISSLPEDIDAIILNIYNSKNELLVSYDDVVGVVTTGKVGGTDPKSDFEIVRKDDKPRVYISHKDGTTPKHFGQWSGVTSRAGNKIAQHPEVIQFIEDIRQIIGQQPDGSYVYPSGISYGKIIKDPELVKMSVYGQDYDPSSDGSSNNVDIVAQGVFELIPVKDSLTKDDKEPQRVFALKANHLIARKNPEPDFSGGYQPTLVSRFATARANYGIKHLRATIYPLGGRKMTMIDNTEET
jgi:hypothetical protein